MRALSSIGIVLALAACGQGEVKPQTEELQTFDVAEAPPPPRAEYEPSAQPAAQTPSQTAPAAAPQIAYTYTYGFRLPADSIAKVQESHLRLCDQAGAARCRVVEMTRSASEGQASNAVLRLQVAAPAARAFGERLVQSASGSGAETVERGIAAEDLSKQIVDADARIRTKQVLVQRLTTLLETRSGNIAQAVEAERAINEAQEELEKGRAWLAEMRGRVAFSTVDISYASRTPIAGSVGNPLRQALDGVGVIFAGSLALIITIIGAALPWLALAALAWWLWRQWRRRAERHDPPASAEAEADAVAGDVPPA
jgi:hypothetical protein